MTATEQQLWRRQTEVYDVELQVGQAWVQYKRFETLGAAEVEATKMASDSSVLRTRVCATRTVQIRTVVREEERPVHVAAPQAFKPTGETTTCRGCQTKDRAVMTDGTTEWVFCTACSRTYPR